MGSIGGIMLSFWDELGSPPTHDDLLRIEKSENYHMEKGIFVNRQNKIIADKMNNDFNWKLINDWFSSGVDRVPNEALPQVKPDLNGFLKPSNQLKTIWFGHSSFLLNMAGKIILVDPVFSESASPLKSLIKRFQEPVLSLEELPNIDFILISHDHYDHLDMESIEFFVNKDVQFVTPLGVGSHLKKWGIDESRITEKDWWQTEVFDNIQFTATPAHHFSGRKGIDANSTLWASWVITSDSHNVYFSGDTGYASHFKEIGERYGPFDVAFIESGQYNENWPDVHMQPSEGVQAFKDLKADKYFPVHWGMFKLALHTWYDPIEQLYGFSKTDKFDLLVPQLGQVVDIDQPIANMVWWQSNTLTAHQNQQPIGSAKMDSKITSALTKNTQSAVN